MEERRTIRICGEVIEEYRRDFPRETVETYAHPLPTAESGPQMEPPRKKTRKRWRNFRIFLEIVAVIALLLVVQRVFFHRAPPALYGDDWYHGDGELWDTADAPVTIPAYPTGQGAALNVTRQQGETLTAQEIYKQVNPSVVSVLVQAEEGAAVGTGVIFREDGYVLTNRHVVAGGTACIIVLDTGVTYDACFVAGDTEADLAVLKIDGTDLPAATFGDSDLLTVGDPVYAIGNPLGVELRGTLTDGIVSAINRDVQVDDRTMTLIQTNAALNSGNSGGPLINRYGQVVGINVIKMDSSYSNIEGLGFAIPTASMQRIVNDLLTYGEAQPEPILGVSVMQEAQELGDGLRGIVVDTVTPGSPAGKAGVLAGDYIVAADGIEILSSNDLLRVRRQHHVGDEMTLTLWRSGSILEVTLRLTDTAD